MSLIIDVFNPEINEYARVAEITSPGSSGSFSNTKKDGIREIIYWFYFPSDTKIYVSKLGFDITTPDNTLRAVISANEKSHLLKVLEPKEKYEIEIITDTSNGEIRRVRFTQE